MDRRLPPPPYRVVVGNSPIVPRIVAELAEAKDAVVVVGDFDKDVLPAHAHLVKGDPTTEAAIRQAQPAQASQALVTGVDDASLLMSAVLLRALAPGLELTALTRTSSVADALRDLGVSQAVSSDDLLSHTMAKTLETPHAGELLLRLVDSDRYALHELPIPGEWAGKPLSHLRGGMEALVMGLVSAGRVRLGVEDDPDVGEGDRILVLERTEPRHV